MVFSTDSDLSYIYLQHKSEKVHGLFGLGWKNQEHTEVVLKNFKTLVFLLSIESKFVKLFLIKCLLQIWKKMK